MLATLHRERLKLRPFNPDDVDAVFEMYSRWEVVQFLGRTPAVLTDRSQAEERVAAWTAFDGALHGVWAQAVADDWAWPTSAAPTATTTWRANCSAPIGRHPGWAERDNLHCRSLVSLITADSGDRQCILCRVTEP